MWNRMWIAYQSKIGFKCVIECQIYYVNECEIAYQSKIEFECAIECQIYCVNKW